MLEAKIAAVVDQSKTLNPDAALQYLIENLTNLVRVEKDAAWSEGAVAAVEYQRLESVWADAGMNGPRPMFGRSPYAITRPEDAARHRCPDCDRPFGFHEQDCPSRSYGGSEGVDHG